MRTYRANASLGPLLGWNLIAAIIIAIVLSRASTSWFRQERWALYASLGALILMGPLALAAYLFQCWALRVDLSREGLILSRRHLVPWEEIRGVELRGWRPGVWNPFPELLSGHWGCWSVIFIKTLLVVAFLVISVWVIRTVLLPVLVLYSPFQSRVVIELTDGTHLVYRDLEDAERFVEEVRGRIRSASSP